MDYVERSACSCARTRRSQPRQLQRPHSLEAAQLRVELAYAHAPLMLAHDRRVLDVPLETRLQSRTSELLAWVRTMLSVINQSIRDAQAQIQTGHRDMRGFFSRVTAVTTDHTATIHGPHSNHPARYELLGDELGTTVGNELGLLLGEALGAHWKMQKVVRWDRN
jgi:hypothetical protein